MFKGSLSASIQQNHQFFVKSGGVLTSLSISSFTESSFSIIYNQNKKYLTGPLFSQLPKLINSNEIFLSLPIQNLQVYFTKFNNTSKQFESSKTTISISDVLNLIKYHENVQFNSQYTKVEALDNLITDINNSLEKSIVFEFILLGSNHKIELSFYERENRSNERKIAIQNQLTFVAPPSTPTGEIYSQSQTINHQKASQSNQSTIISRQKSNNYDPQDAVAAPLQMFYDSNTHTFKSGNVQILAILLEDIDEASMVDLEDIDIKNPINAQSIREKFNYKTGKALLLSIQNGNPYQFGPIYAECLTKNAIEILVVNRSSRKFLKNEMITATEINGEWIPQALDNVLTKQSSFKVGEWSFVKFMASSDAYFKSNTFLSTGFPQSVFTNQIYTTQSRAVFYSKHKNILASSYYNYYTPTEIESMVSNNKNVTLSENFTPSKNYLSSVIFDQVSEELGGFADDSLSLLKNINSQGLENLFTITEIQQSKKERCAFWGPLFYRGYTNIIFNNNITSDDLYFKTPTVDLSNPSSIDNVLSKYFTGGSAIPKNIPAEITSNLYNSIYIINNWINLGSSDFKINEASKVIKPIFYGSQADFSSIQFSALSLELAGSNYTVRTEDGKGSIIPRIYRDFQVIGNNANPTLKDYVESVLREALLAPIGISLGSDYNLFGKMQKRASQHGVDFKEFYIPLGCLVNNVNIRPPISAKGFSSDHPQLDNYNCANGLSHKGSNLIGMIGAHTTISKSGGGNIKFSVQQSFGSKIRQTVSGGQVDNFFFGSLIGSNPSQINSFPSWGSADDSYNSFGTLALHIRIFDYWPQNQTVFDSRYFSVLHFNPGELTTTEGTTSVDLLTPKYESGDILKYGSTVSKTEKLLPQSGWAKNTIRRGQLLTNGNFHYLKHVIGLGDNYKITEGGSGFNVGDIITIATGAIIEVVSTGTNGSLSRFKFVTNEDSWNKYLERGQNVTHTSFENTGKLTISFNPKSAGKSATIDFMNGVCYTIGLIDKAPIEYTSGGSRLTNSSNRGNGTGEIPKGHVKTTLETQISVESNNSGKYDCFFHFHNDVGLLNASDDDPPQYIILNIV